MPLTSSTTREHEVQAEIDRSLYKAVQEASPDGILVVDARGDMVSYNGRFLELWGIEPEDIEVHADENGVMPEPPLLSEALKKLKKPEAFLERVAELYANPRESDYTEVELVDGRTLERHSEGLYDEHDRHLGRVWYFRDITSRKQLEAALRQNASYDTLTRQMNRRYFLECAGEEFERARRFGQKLAVMMLDLDHFKAVNDQHGHAAGDCVLESACRRWRDILRNVDLLGRLGGEEFAVALPQIDESDARSVAERLCRAVGEQHFELPEGAVAVTVSVGVAMVVPGDESVDDTLKRADEALYEAKKQGRNRVARSG